MDKRRAKNDETYPLVFRLSHQRMNRDIPTGFSLLANQWDSKSRRALKSHPQCLYLDAKLREQELEYLCRVLQFENAHTGVFVVQKLRGFLCNKKVNPAHVKIFWQLETESIYTDLLFGKVEIQPINGKFDISEITGQLN